MSILKLVLTKEFLLYLIVYEDKSMCVFLLYNLCREKSVKDYKIQFKSVIYNMSWSFLYPYFESMLLYLLNQIFVRDIYSPV